MSGHRLWQTTRDAALITLRWRTGRKNPRTLYVQIGDEPSDDDPCIGMLDTAAIAAEAVAAHNERLK